MSPPPSQLLAAFQHYQSGQLSQAELLCQEILQDNPQQFDTLHLSGVLAYQQGQVAEAIAFYQRALGQNWDHAEVHNNLGIALLDSHRLSDAISHFQTALSLKPDYADAHHNLGHGFRQQGALDRAIAQYQQALTLNPQSALFLNSLGVAYKEQGQLEEALACYQQALTLQPNYTIIHNNMGNLLRSQGRNAEAIAHFEQALAKNPDYTDARRSLAHTLQEQGLLSKAETQYRQALQTTPADGELQISLANCLQKQGQLGEAIALYHQALTLQPQNPQILNNLAKALKDQGQVAEALPYYRQAVAFDSQSSVHHSNLLFALQYQSPSDLVATFTEHQRWAKRHAEPLTPLNLHPNTPDPQRPLRIGYVSPDFCTHSVASFIEPILQTHQAEQYEIYGYANVAHPDETTTRLQSQIHHWRSIWGLADEAVDAYIRHDQIDILVDLTGHTANNRLLVFARKPAPIQVTYMGYPNTTGLPAIDYRLTDAYADPPRALDGLYSETLVRLPRSFLCYQPPENSPTIAPPPILSQGYITFGSFNNLAKLSPEILACWAIILQRVPNSRLLLKYRGLGDRPTQQYWLNTLGHYGIASERLELLDRISDRTNHLSIYNQIDIALDAFPYNGTTTTCEALWMGVPVITLAGIGHLSRVGVSVLTNTGLSDCIATSPEDYINLAVDWAKNPSRLDQQRQNQRQQLLTSPLLDKQRFTRELETTYRWMWHQWCEQQNI